MIGDILSVTSYRSTPEVELAGGEPSPHRESIAHRHPSRGVRTLRADGSRARADNDMTGVGYRISKGLLSSVDLWPSLKVGHMVQWSAHPRVRQINIQDSVWPRGRWGYTRGPVGQEP
jgi:hypothetical protein